MTVKASKVADISERREKNRKPLESRQVKSNKKVDQFDPRTEKEAYPGVIFLKKTVWRAIEFYGRGICPLVEINGKRKERHTKDLNAWICDDCFVLLGRRKAFIVIEEIKNYYYFSRAIIIANQILKRRPKIAEEELKNTVWERFREELPPLDRVLSERALDNAMQFVIKKRAGK